MSFENLLGLITASNETMQNASKVANGYKTILTNLMTKDLEEQFNDFGLTMRDQNGAMKDSFTILRELSEVYRKLGTTIGEDGESTVSLNDKMNKLLKDISGSHNINILTSGFDHFEQAINASNDALNSAGSAQEEYAVAMDTITKKLEGLKGQFLELVQGDGGLSKFLKLLIDLGTVVLKFANSDIGQLIIKLGALAGAWKLLNMASTKLSSNIIRMAKDFIALRNGQMIATQSTIAMTVATKGLWATLAPFVKGTAIVAGIYALSKAFDYCNLSMETMRKNTQANIDEYNSLQSEFDSIIDSLGNLTEEQKKYLKEINTGDSNYNQMYDDLITKSGELNESEKLRLDLLKAQIEAKQTLVQQDYELESRARQYGTAGSKETSFVDSDTTEAQESNYKKAIGIKVDTELVSIYNLVTAYKVLDETKAESLTQDDEIKAKKAEIMEALSNEGLHLLDLKDSVGELSDSDEELLEMIESVTGGLEDENDELEDNTDAQDDNISATEDMADALADFGIYSSKTGKHFSKSMKEMNEATKEQQDYIQELAREIDDLTSAYQVVVNAIDEYNNQGYLSVDTYSQLMQVAPEYLAMMIDENGQLYANADGANVLYQAKVYEMGVTAARAQVNLASSLANEAGAYADLGNTAIDASGGIWELVKAEMAEEIASIKDPRDLQALNNRVDAINDLTQSTMANTSAITSNIQPTNRNTGATNRNTGARRGNAGATKAQTDALKAHKKALEAEADALKKEIDRYEDLFDYIEHLLEKEKEAIEKEKDTVLGAIDEKLEALDKEHEEYEDNIESQIDLLEKQKEAEAEYWDKQINDIKNANKVLDENIKLQQLQEALARAKTQKVKIFKDGKFVYAEDEEAISKAEQELADYEMQLAVQRQIEELERLKNEALDTLDEQIKKLEEARDNANKVYQDEVKDLETQRAGLESQYDARISEYEAYQERFRASMDAQRELYGEKLLAEFGVEKMSWDERLKYFDTFIIPEYNNRKEALLDIQGQIDDIGKAISGIESDSSRALGAIGGRLGKAQEMQRAINAIADARRTQYRGYVVNSKSHKPLYLSQPYDDSGSAQFDAHNWGLNYEGLYPYQRRSVRTFTYAKGSYSIPEDQIALVADSNNPSNRELVIGSKLNRGDGVMTNLQAGTGIIPHGQNLTEKLVNLARWSDNGGIEKITNNSKSFMIHVDNINLPEVHNGEDFVTYLTNNFINQAIQTSNVR